MARVGNFETKRERRDAGEIRPDDESKRRKQQLDEGLLAELNRVGFDEDYSEEPQEEQRETIDEEPLKPQVELDMNGNPVIPEDWTYIAHGSSMDRWDISLLGSDFTVGNGVVNGRPGTGRPLCCVERDIAKWDYERSGASSAKSYGGDEHAFEIRVLLFKDPRLGTGQGVKEKLTPEQVKEVSKYYMYQGGRHPAVPVGTKLTFLKRGGFDDITNTDGNNILWYIPEQYIEQYLEDVQRMVGRSEVSQEQPETKEQLKEKMDEETLDTSKSTQDFMELMHTSHEDNLYMATDEYSKLELQFKLDYYNMENNGGLSEAEYIGQRFGEIYESRFDGEKKELAGIFARLEQEAVVETKENYDDRFLDTQKEKYLLAMTKVNNEGFGDYYVAIYETRENDEEEFKPVYEYYTIDADGDLVLESTLDHYVFEEMDGVVITHEETRQVLQEYVKETPEVQQEAKEETGFVLKSVNGKDIRANTAPQNKAEGKTGFFDSLRADVVTDDAVYAKNAEKINRAELRIEPPSQEEK